MLLSIKYPVILTMVNTISQIITIKNKGDCKRQIPHDVKIAAALSRPGQPETSVQCLAVLVPVDAGFFVFVVSVNGNLLIFLLIPQLT